MSVAEDYPSGTWLGDENNPEMRVRCPITPADMLHISTNCRTAEKMALTLLDYLFHREIQAISNLSGQGKHGKKQLDPLMIYGIRCEYVLLPGFRALAMSAYLQLGFWTVESDNAEYLDYKAVPCVSRGGFLPSVTQPVGLLYLGGPVAPSRG